MNKQGKEIEVNLKIKLKIELEDIPENDKDTVRFLVEDDLKELGYEIDSVEIIE